MPQLIACVHATPRAIPPTHQMLDSYPAEFTQRDVLDESLFQLDAVSGEGFETFLGTVSRAASLQPAAILTTCSMYTQHLPVVRTQVETPIVGIDEAMIRCAAEVQGALALVGSRPESIAFTRRQIEARARRTGRIPLFTDTLCVPVDACDTISGTKELAKQVRKLAQHVEAVVIVQLSLSPVSKHLPQEEHRILTSPRLALQQLRTVLAESASK